MCYEHSSFIFSGQTYTNWGKGLQPYSLPLPVSSSNSTTNRVVPGHNGLVAIWSFVEANVALVCASLPTFRQLILHVFPRLLPSSARKSYSRRSEKGLQDPGCTWGPFTGPSNYSADVSVSADQDSASHCEDGIQVVRELRWETGSVASGSENAEPENKAERGEPVRIPTPTIQFE